MGVIGAWRRVLQLALRLGIERLHIHTQDMPAETGLAPELLKIICAVLERTTAPIPWPALTRALRRTVISAPDIS
ncbi:hypothetical protein D3C85_1677730 [compost metagenome]